MPQQKAHVPVKLFRLLCAAATGFIACTALSGCLVAGYSSAGGGFVWPGGLGLVFVLLVVLWFLLRRR
ncbi:MAG: hypothetical protein ACRYGF_12525 [Janthinobacterium lividum]